MGHADDEAEPATAILDSESSTPGDVDSDSTVREPAEATVGTDSKPETSGTLRSAPLNPDADAESRPALPLRPGNLDLLQEGTNTRVNSLKRQEKSSRPHLQATATTALSRTDIHTQAYQDGSRETFAASAHTTPPTKSSLGFGSIRRLRGIGGSDGGDSASVKSYAPTLETGGDVESILGEVLAATQGSPAWKLLSTQAEAPDPFDSMAYQDDEITADFYREFDEICGISGEDDNEGDNPLMSTCHVLIC